jgi:Protein of unknown function (DUF3306)
MANEETPAGFLSRWSRRKAEVRQAPETALANSALPASKLVNAADQHDEKPQQSESATPQKPAPSMSDVQSLTKDSDYTQFMAGEVAPEVKNAAMKKLFTDPHFNVMDRMDVYIDDYGQPDPIPQAMLRQMVSAKFLNLFEDDDDEKKDAHANLNDIPTANDTQVVAQSVPAVTISNTEPLTHDHTDLRLQPDPAPRPQGAGSKPV